MNNKKFPIIKCKEAKTLMLKPLISSFHWNPITSY